MIQEQIIEGNKLIAEFMGYDGQHEDWCGNNILQFDEFLGHNDLIPYRPNESWNDLMPVVIKIESLGYSVFIQNDCCWIRVARAGMKLGLISNLADDKIMATFLSVIDFIKWYNQQSK